jgi:hypothetical protein
LLLPCWLPPNGGSHPDQYEADEYCRNRSSSERHSPAGLSRTAS